MFEQSGLSLDQAPPIGVVFGLFQIGSIFGILSGCVALYYGVDILDPSATGAVVMTHILSVGVMLFFMLGALFQMLPVIAGVSISSPVKKANLIQYTLVVGLLSLLSGFIVGADWLFWIASVLLGGALLHTSVMMILRLTKIQNHTASSRGMLIALIALLMTVGMALYMTATLGGLIDGSLYVAIKKAHYSYGLYGWIALLIISISFQTIEMFYVTPPYPKAVSRYMPSFLLITLTVTMLFGLIQVMSAWIMTDMLLAIALIVYATLILVRMSQRKRPLADATVWFWRFGMGSLIASMLSLLLNSFVHIEALSSAMMILFVSFALSILFAMFYKIVPFLTWFHLNSQGYFTAPMMHEVIHPKTAKKHLWIHVATIASYLLSVLLEPVMVLSALLTMLSFGWVAYQVIRATELYRDTQESGERFDMG